MDLAEIKNRLAGQTDSIVKMLLPRGKRVGQEWQVGNLAGMPGSSLSVHLAGAKAGVWADFATGESGDIIDLWVKVKNVSVAQAIGDMKAWLGITNVNFTPAPKVYRRPPIPKQVQKAQASSVVMHFLTDMRKLSPETIAAYKVAEQLTGNTPTVVLPFKRGDELIGIKYFELTPAGDAIARDEHGKRIIRVESGTEPCLFGWQAIPDTARSVIITEGEWDAMTWYQYGFPALSVPFGAGTKGKQKWIEYEFGNLDRFEEILISMDADEEGQKTIFELVDRLGRHRCLVVKLPTGFKDSNECLQAGVSKERMSECIRNASTVDPAELRRASEFVEEVVDSFYPKNGVVLGFAPPWDSLAQVFRFRPGELTVWSGWNGHGKSMIISQVLLSAMQQGEKACIASLEIRPRYLLKRMVRQATAQRVPPEDEIRMLHDWLNGRLWIFDLVGTAKTGRLLEVFEYARKRYGITQFLIDSLMKCGMAEDDYNAQKTFVEELADFSNGHDVHCHLVAHSRKRDSDREIGNRMDIKGTGAITDIAHNCFLVWRNKKKEEKVREAAGEVDPKLREMADTILTCDKSREGEWEGRISLWYDQASLQYRDTPGGAPEAVGAEPLFDAVNDGEMVF